MTRSSGSEEAVTVPVGYRLVWSDEFEVDGRPDPTKWAFETGFVRNEEAQWYQPENARVEGGLLVVEARREQKANPDHQPGSSNWKTNRSHAEYTSASLLTRGLHAWEQGRFEMRARIDPRAGLWPAWWTLGRDGEWPWCGEITILECCRGKLRAGSACGTMTRWSPKRSSAERALVSFRDPDWSQRFHVWRMDWDEDRIELWVDDQRLHSADLNRMVNPDGRCPFRQPHHMIVNLAVGGTQGGDPTGTSFPARFEVDYVRVFQREDQAT